eukprot:8086-Heterococcus_DN1.PRE.5
MHQNLAQLDIASIRQTRCSALAHSTVQLACSFASLQRKLQHELYRVTILTGLNSPSKYGSKKVSNRSPDKPSRSSAYGSSCAHTAESTSTLCCVIVQRCYIAALLYTTAISALPHLLRAYAHTTQQVRYTYRAQQQFFRARQQSQCQSAHRLLVKQVPLAIAVMMLFKVRAVGIAKQGCTTVAYAAAKHCAVKATAMRYSNADAVCDSVHFEQVAAATDTASYAAHWHRQ